MCVVQQGTGNNTSVYLCFILLEWATHLCTAHLEGFDTVVGYGQTWSGWGREKRLSSANILALPLVLAPLAPPLPAWAPLPALPALGVVCFLEVRACLAGG